MEINHQELKSETVKQLLVDKAIRGWRINHLGRCLFSGFALNQDVVGRVNLLKSRLQTLAIPDAVFEIQVKNSTGYSTVETLKVVA